MGSQYYLGADVGASKTLFAVFEPSGKLVFEHKIKTPSDYEQFKSAITQAIKRDLGAYQFSHACCAVPGIIDFDAGVAAALGNEDWRNAPIKSDLKSIMPGVQILIQNDANLAGLGEAILLQKKYNKVLYITISTGIGGGVIINDVISGAYNNFEPGQMVFEDDGQTHQWEDIASGRTLKNRYGQLASEINDPVIWQEYAKTLVLGFESLLAIVQPDVVIVGGGVGAHFEKFERFLKAGLEEINNPVVPLPPILKAQRPEEAVIYGCYDYIKQNL